MRPSLVRGARAGAACALLLLCGSTVHAGWWHRHHCHASSSYGYAAPAAESGFAPAPSSAPAAAAAPAAAPAYYYYYAAPAAAPIQAAPQPQAFISQIRDALEIIRVIREVLPGLGGGPGPGPGPDVPPLELTGVSEALKRLEAGQADLRSRLISNAEIGQGIGKSLVEVGARQEVIIGKLDEVLRKLTPPPGPAAPRGPVPPAPAP